MFVFEHTKSARVPPVVESAADQAPPKESSNLRWTDYAEAELEADREWAAGVGPR